MMSKQDSESQIIEELFPELQQQLRRSIEEQLQLKYLQLYKIKLQEARIQNLKSVQDIIRNKQLLFQEHLEGLSAETQLVDAQIDRLLKQAKIDLKSNVLDQLLANQLAQSHIYKFVKSQIQIQVRQDLQFRYQKLLASQKKKLFIQFRKAVDTQMAKQPKSSSQVEVLRAKQAEERAKFARQKSRAMVDLKAVQEQSIEIAQQIDKYINDFNNQLKKLQRGRPAESQFGSPQREQQSEVVPVSEVLRKGRSLAERYFESLTGNHSILVND